MPALSDYTAGTITLTNGSVNFTGVGTGWQAADFREGDTILGIEDHAGVEYVIASITGNGAGTLTQEWEGATGTYQYRMRYMADGARVTAQARNLIELLGNGNLQTLAGLTGPGVPVFDGPNSMTIKPETDFLTNATPFWRDRLTTDTDAAAARAGLKAVSYAGQTLSLAEQGQARANIGADVLAGFRNKLINGGCEIGQRGMTGTIAAGTSGFGPDRTIIVNNTNQPLTWSIDPSFNFITGEARNFLNINFAVAPTTNNVDIVQRVENVFTLAGQKASLVFYCSSNVSAANSVMVANIFQNFGTGGSPSSVVNTSMSALNVPAVRDDSTVRRHATVDVPSVIGKTLGTNNNDFLGVRVSFVPRQAGDYRFTRFAFVAGDATAETDPFSPRHIQQELALCQRYTQLRSTNSVNAADLRPNMRAAPSVSGSGPYLYDAEL